MPEQTPIRTEDKTDFRLALERTINMHCMENGSNTPDFVLAQFLTDCLTAFDKATQYREAWYGRESEAKRLL